jgi:CHAT domain-containing protein
VPSSHAEAVLGVRVRWAVLSACRTGVGIVRDVDIAGAGTLIMSLWRVEDEATAAWMGVLYRAHAQPSSSADSVCAASLALLAAQRAAGGSPHP